MPESDHLYERLYNMMVEAYTDRILEIYWENQGKGLGSKGSETSILLPLPLACPLCTLFDTKKVAYHS